MSETNPAAVDLPARKTRGRYVTLVVLLLWVAAVFAFTFLKFSGGLK